MTVLKNIAGGQRKKVFYQKLYQGVCKAYWTENALESLLTDACQTYNEGSLPAPAHYYKLVVGAHLQKLGNIFGHLEIDSREIEDNVTKSLLTDEQGRKRSHIFREGATILLLIKIAHLKAAQYRTLELHAKDNGYHLIASILRRMYEEECEASDNLLDSLARSTGSTENQLSL